MLPLSTIQSKERVRLRSELFVAAGHGARTAAILLLGHDGYRFAWQMWRHLLRWLIYVLLAELGAAGTEGVLWLFRAQSSVAGVSAATIHTAIVIVGLLGFLLAVLLDGIDLGMKRLVSLLDTVELVTERMLRIRCRWKGKTDAA